MADIYLSSVDGNDADSGLTWALAKATLQAALTAAGAGGRVFVDSNHSESYNTGQTLTSAGTAAAPQRVVCVDRTGDPEPPTTLATGALFQTATTADSITFAGFVYYYGITFNINVGGSFISSGASFGVIFDTCQLLNANGGFAYGAAANIGQYMEIRNCTVNCTAGFGSIRRGFRVVNSTWVTAPAVLLTFASEAAGQIDFIGCDLSVLGAGSTLANIDELRDMLVRFVDCKLGASLAVSTGTATDPYGGSLVLVNCDSADTQTRFARHMRGGAETSELTVVRTGGATDGTTPFSRKVVTPAIVEPTFPYRSLPLAFWNESLEEITVSVAVVTDGVTLTDLDVWIEVEYPGVSGFPQGVIASDRLANFVLGTPANQPLDAVSEWGGSLSSPVKQTLSVTFTPAEIGFIRVWVCCGDASLTFYYDPLPQVA